MAIVDRLNTFCKNATCNGTNVEAALGDVIDFGVNGAPGGGAHPMWLMVHFSVAGASTGTWWELALYTDADGTLPAAGALIGKWRFTNDQQAAGSIYFFPVGGGLSKRWLRYVGVTEVSSGAYGTKPVVTVALTMDPSTALQ